MEDTERISKSMNVLFVCSQNKLRSPTAEQVFSTWDGLEVASAGTNNDACVPLDAETVMWADVIFVMERSHRNKVRRKFQRALDGKRIICLDIPDDYEFMERALVSVLISKVPRFLPTIRPPEQAASATEQRGTA
jgi:predicted protein tyrosine phosphatase